MQTLTLVGLALLVILGAYNLVRNHGIMTRSTFVIALFGIIIGCLALGVLLYPWVMRV